MIDPLALRDVCGQFATGVTIVTAREGDELVGMSANSFTSVSLDPPLVGFCAAHTSTTYPRIRRARTFCVNVLSSHQSGIARLFSLRGVDRASAVASRPGPAGSPIIEGGLAWMECELETEFLAGDHVIALGRVLACDSQPSLAPLLFFRGRFGLGLAEAGLEEAPAPEPIWP